MIVHEIRKSWDELTRLSIFLLCFFRNVVSIYSYLYVDLYHLFIPYQVSPAARQQFVLAFFIAV